MYFEKNPIDSDPKDQIFEDKNLLRHDSAKLLRKISKVIGFKNVFRLIANSIASSVHVLQSSNEMQENILIIAEAKLEAELHSVQAILTKADRNDEETFKMVQQLLELVLTMTYNKQILLGTALEIMVEGSEFFGSRVDMLQSAFKFLANCIQYPNFEDNAAEAISNLCKNNKHFVMENISDFFECTYLFTDSLFQSVLQERHRDRIDRRDQLSQQYRNEDRIDKEDLPAVCKGNTPISSGSEHQSYHEPVSERRNDQNSHQKHRIPYVCCTEPHACRTNPYRPHHDICIERYVETLRRHPLEELRRDMII